MELIVNVNPKAALRAGASAAGRQIVTFDAGALSPEDREALGRCTAPERSAGGTCDTGRLVLAIEIDAPTIEAALVACRARVAEIAAAKAAEDARREAEDAATLAAALAAPDAAWRSSDATVRTSPDGLYLPERLREHPAIVARRGELERRCVPQWREELARAEAEKAAKREAEREAERAAAEARDAAARAIAARYDRLARAAAEGYAVERAVLDALAGDVAAKLRRGGAFATVDTRTWPSPTERAAPSPDVLALRDACVFAAASVELPAVLGRWEVSRVVRVDVAPAPRTHYVTAVLVRLLDNDGDVAREITVSLEPQEAPDTDEE